MLCPRPTPLNAGAAVVSLLYITTSAPPAQRVRATAKSSHSKACAGMTTQGTPRT